MQEDVSLVKKTGFTVYRFSIAWSRILPSKELRSLVFLFFFPKPDIILLINKTVTIIKIYSQMILICRGV